MSERTYTESELSAERAALLREMKVPLLELVDEFRSGAAEYDVKGADDWESHKAVTYTECADKLRDCIRALAIPTDQSALARHDADLLKNREYRDILNYVEDYERMSRKEFSATHGEDIAAALAGVEAVAYARAKQDVAKHWPEREHRAPGYCVVCSCGWQSPYHKQEIADSLVSNLDVEWRQHILALQDRGREAEK